MTVEERLAKARAKSLAHHFGKAAAHHHSKADHHEKAADMHKAHADHHAEMAAESDDATDKKHHKAAASFHKSKAAHHEKLHKMHKAYAAHNEAMKAAHEEEADAEKIYKALEIEPPKEETLNANDMSKTQPTTPAAAAPATPATPATPAVAAPAAGTPSISENFGEYIQQALDKKLSESVDGAFERLLSSDDFNKRVDQEVAKKMLEKLGATTIETPIRTTSVPRPGESTSTSTSVDKRYDGIREDLLDFVKSE